MQGRRLQLGGLVVQLGAAIYLVTHHKQRSLRMLPTCSWQAHASSSAKHTPSQALRRCLGASAPLVGARSSRARARGRRCSLQGELLRQQPRLIQ